MRVFFFLKVTGDCAGHSSHKQQSKLMNRTKDDNFGDVKVQLLYSVDY